MGWTLGVLMGCWGWVAPAAEAHSIGAYVTNATDYTVSQYTVGADGALNSRVPASVPGPNNPQGIVVSPDGRSVYVTGFGGSELAQYDVLPDGSLSHKLPATVATGGQPQSVTEAPDGRSVYVVNYASNSISQYDVGADGTLAPKTPATVPAGTNPEWIAVSPDGRSVYVTDNGSGAVSQYDVGAAGALSPKTPATVPSTNPIAIVLTPDGRNLYVTNGSNAVSQYDVSAGGELSPKLPPTVPTGSLPEGAAVSPDGRSLYVTNNGSDTVSQYDIGAGGVLTPKGVPNVATGHKPVQIAIAPDGRSAYVADSGLPGSSTTVSQYDIGASGELSPKASPTATSGNNPFALALAPDQGPTASFTASPGRPGSATTFDGSASSDSDGGVVRYDWSFGDGSGLSTGSPHVSHTYAAPGSYAVSLTVTDETGCSTSLVFTGQTAYCHGTSAATSTRTVTVPPAPSATTLPASPVGTTTAVLHGLVNAGGGAVSWQFQFGQSTAYNKGTPVQTLAAAGGSTPVSWRLIQLAPNTLYHFRLVVLDAGGGKTYGRDLTFRTKATGRLLLSSRRLVVRSRFLALRLRCSSRLACAGRFSITTRAKLAKTRKLASVTCATSFFRVKPGKTRRVTTNTYGACLTLLRAARNHVISAKFTSRPRTGQTGLIVLVKLVLK
jgi:DNA-binding beta-propeller fold protein YncE